ncbi:MAG: TonB-dependent receptor [Haliscomenobacter sp.]|nr:TonB-dependent receptor [Haliscomenobacter sp.]MBK9488435.1 TonB-dependent receptor [Haliscomenobacter sp.]
MRLNCLHLLLFFLLANSASAQINGRVIDQTGVALPFVNVILHQAADSSFIAGTNSDENGAFALSIPHAGRFIIGLSSIGHQAFFSNPIEIRSTSAKLDLGDLQLLEAVNALEGIEITAKKDLIQITPLGKVINVQGSMMSQGSSALQILERIPGLSIDYRNNTLMLNGQSGVSILINGRAVRLPLAEVMAMLSGMSGDNIEKIELITSPTAQYDAEGGAGLINIVLKKNAAEGTQLSLSSSLGYGWREKASTSLNLMHGHKNLNYQLGYAFLHDGSISNWHAIGSQNVPSLGGYNEADFYSATQNRKNAHNFSLGFEQKIGSKTLWEAS